jgi:hypothetical protein
VFSFGRLLGYAVCTVGNKEVDALIHDLHNVTLDAYWTDRNRMIDRHYAGMDPTEPLFTDAQRYLICNRL